ncbi:MAG: signal recognition particle-docking protein FtsY [Anaerolineales bacterium]|nr:signal recognition particle-docking protein FtsY [Anaerolineales bacterium]
MTNSTSSKTTCKRYELTPFRSLTLESEDLHGWYNSPVKREDWREALSRTRKSTFGRVAGLLGATELDAHFWDELEASMIQADLGTHLAIELIDELKEDVKKEGITKGSELHLLIRSKLLDRVQPLPENDTERSPFVITVIGVNGSGKTTTAARLAHRYKVSGKDVLLVAADTYRAAAGDQLELWANRLGLEIILGQPGADPGAVVYDAAQAAIARDVDILIIDTSGRMHTHHNLMAELQKVHRVAGKVIPGAPHQVLLVLDATTGQNGLSQAKAFSEAVSVTGVVLAKLDSSSRGGVGFGVASELDLPIQYVGLGECEDDLIDFNAESYVDGLLAE